MKNCWWQTDGVTSHEHWHNPRCRNEPFRASCYYALRHIMHSLYRLFELCKPKCNLHVSASAACNVWYLGSVEMESLTGVQAVQKASTMILNSNPPPTSTLVHFKVSSQGITLTDNQRKWAQHSFFTLCIYCTHSSAFLTLFFASFRLFFRRHYNVNTVIYCALDSQDRKWVLLI